MNKKNHYKPLYKKFLRLKVNPLNNNKLLKKVLIQLPPKLKIIKIQNQRIKKTIPQQKIITINKFKSKKWLTLLTSLRRNTGFYRKYKPYTYSCYNASKFASQGNSFKKKFKNNLLAKRSFNYYYGRLLKKFLKNQMTKIYTSQKSHNLTTNCLEFFESRLDSVLYRSKFCTSMKEARQLIAHKHITVNHQIEKTRSYILKPGDLIAVKSESRGIIKEKLKKQLRESSNSVTWPWPLPPSYLTINYKTLEIIFGNIKDFNFSTLFTFKLDTHSIVTSHYRD